MPFPELYFNVDNGYLEGLVRGFKAGILSQADYLNLVQCETLEGESEQLLAEGFELAANGICQTQSHLSLFRILRVKPWVYINYNGIYVCNDKYSVFSYCHVYSSCHYDGICFSTC